MIECSKGKWICYVKPKYGATCQIYPMWQPAQCLMVFHSCMIGLSRQDFPKLELDLIIGILTIYIGIPNSRCLFQAPGGLPRSNSIFSSQRYFWSSLYKSGGRFPCWLYIAQFPLKSMYILRVGHFIHIFRPSWGVLPVPYAPWTNSWYWWAVRKIPILFLSMPALPDSLPLLVT